MPNLSTSEYQPTATRPDEYLLVRALLNASDGFVSGSQLAETLKISRPAIWGKIKKLTNYGFEIEGIRNRGYRLKAPPEVLHPTLLQLTLEEQGLEMDCLYFRVLDSTNNEAERQVANGRRGPFVVFSSCQTKGRGRRGREWYSGSAENLYLTVTYEPQVPAQQLQHFNLWCGIQLCRALQEVLPQSSLQIKWPNDLFCDGRKFAGMLTEATLDADGMKTLFFGLGINVNSNPNQFPRELRSSTTSLRAISGATLPLNTLAARILKAIQEAYDICMLNPDRNLDHLQAAWAPLDYLRGRKVTAEQPKRTLQGIACGIDSSGALLLDTGTNEPVAIHAADVTLTQF